jgi:glycosyltransferase involved in cell wall biosynthesis
MKYTKYKILFFVSEDWYFCSHRLPLAKAAHNHNYEVGILTKVDKHDKFILESRLQLIPIKFCRSGKNPITDIIFLWNLYRLLRKHKPDIIHNVALKPVLYGTIAARFANVPIIINALGGMGSLFISKTPLSRLLKTCFLQIFSVLINRKDTKIILQNKDDIDLLISKTNIKRKTISLIRGAGVNLTEFSKTIEPKEPLVIVLVSRMLWDKGVGEFVEAAQMLRKNG